MFFLEYDILRKAGELLTVQGGVPIACMAEEPNREASWMEEEEEKSVSPVEKARKFVQDTRERLAQGGVFALAVFFVIGTLFGIAAKSVAGRSVTIGYWDYTVSPRDRGAVDLNAVQKKLLVQEEEAMKKQEEEMKKAEEASSGDEKDAEIESEGNSPEVPAELPPLPPAPEPPLLPETER